MDSAERSMSPAAIRSALERLIDSVSLKTSPRLSAFLRFVVEAALEGRADSIKAYTVAVDGLGRPASFDPETDPIVRVEAGRLRRALACYYAGEGRHDPIAILLPIGSYVPQFRNCEPGIQWPTADAELPARGGDLSNCQAPHAAEYRCEMAELRAEIENLRKEILSAQAVLGEIRAALESRDSSAAGTALPAPLPQRAVTGTT